MATKSDTITAAAAELDRAIDALLRAATRVEEAVGTDESDIASGIIDDLCDIRPSVRLVDRAMRLLDELAIERGEA
jgi:hypothetical protein